MTSARKDALAFAARELDKLNLAGLVPELVDAGRSIVLDAIHYRREHPLRFYLFHARLRDVYAKQGRMPRSRYHARLAERYDARVFALVGEAKAEALRAALDACLAEAAA